MEIAKKTWIPTRDIFPREDTDFNPFIKDNLDILDEELNLGLNRPKLNTQCGSFSCDILCYDDNDEKVVIENQYGSSNHDHLGKIITYSSNIGAKTAIWMVETAREEHITSVDDLNKKGMKIFMVEFSFVKIETSKPALELKVVCYPHELVSESSGDSESSSHYSDLWTQLKDKNQGKYLENYFADNKKNIKDLCLKTKRTSYFLRLKLLPAKSCVSIDITVAQKDDKNKSLYDYFSNNKQEISNRLPNSSWEPMKNPDQDRFKIRIKKELNPEDKQNWPEIIQWFSTEGENLHKIALDILKKSNP